MISLKTFTGEYPRQQPQLLPDNAAINAIDCDFSRGDLIGIRERVSVPGLNVPAGVKSIYIHDGLASSLFAWTRDVDAVRGPVPNDEFNRFYWTDGTGFYVSRGDVGGNGQEPSATNRYKVGCPCPAAPLTINSARSALALPGVSSISYAAIYEVTELETALGAPSVAAHTMSALTETWSTSLSTTRATESGVTETLFLRLTCSMTDGSTQTVLVRTSGSNTIPSCFSAYSFSFYAASRKLTLSISFASDHLEYRAYSYAYVNQYGEESGLAEPLEVDTVDGQSITLNYTTLPDTSGYCPISLIRIYRTATGSSSTNYLFVGEVVVNAGSPTYTDTKMGDELGAASASVDFEAPPQNMRGLCLMNNGILCGFIGSDLYFMEPYLPYAYRPSTIKPLPHGIVGICPTDDGLYVTTTAFPYLITGVSPDSMTDRRVPAIQAGVSKGSVCNVGSTVVYASNDGLVALRGVDASLDMSSQFFTRNTWRDLYRNKLHLMRLNAHDGALIVWFEDGTPGFVLRPWDAPASLSKLSDPVYAAFVYAVGDALYLADGSSVYEYNGGSKTKPFSWASKEFVLSRPSNFGCIQILGAGAVRFAITADGVTRHTQSVTLDANGAGVYRLPSGFSALRWSVAVSGNAGSRVSEMSLAFSPTELQNG